MWTDWWIKWIFRVLVVLAIVGVPFYFATRQKADQPAEKVTPTPPRVEAPLPRKVEKPVTEEAPPSARVPNAPIEHASKLIGKRVFDNGKGVPYPQHLGRVLSVSPDGSQILVVTGMGILTNAGVRVVRSSEFIETKFRLWGEVVQLNISRKEFANRPAAPLEKK